MYLQREPLALGAVPKASGFALQWNISFKQPKAYIPLRRKTIRVGSWRWLGPPTPQFCVTYTNMLVSKNPKICGTPNAKYKICVTPNASQWNIGCVGSQTQNLCVGHVHFMLFVLISFALVTQREPSLQWNMGLRECKIALRSW